MQVKGKAAIDVVCNPLGKSGGALIQQFLILGFGSLANSTPYLGAILLVIVVAWLAAARSLDRQFTPLVQEDLKGKLLEGKLSAISSRLLAKSLSTRKEVSGSDLSTSGLSLRYLRNGTRIFYHSCSLRSLALASMHGMSHRSFPSVLGAFCNTCVIGLGFKT